PWGKLSKSHFKELAQKEFDDPVHELWRIIVLKRNSIGGGLNFAEKSHYRNEPIPDFRDRALKRLRRANERLKNVKVHQADFEKTIKDWDGPDTVFLIDPPYFERDEYYNLGFSLADIKRLCKALKSIKGKFILLHTKSQGFDLARELSDFHCHSFRWESPIQHMSREGGLEVEKRRLLVIWNFGSPALVKETLPAEPSPGEDAVSPEVSVAKRNEIALEDLDWQDEEPVEFEKLRGAFKSPGGKYHLFKKILAHVPEHEVYVEPFCGGAQVFFHKVRSAEEVISDIDNDLIFSYRFIKSMTPQDLEWLKQQAWVIAKRQAKRLFKRRPASRRQRFYRFAYLNKATYLGKAHVWSTPRTVGPSGAGARIGLVERLSEIQERLKGVRIHCWDWKETIARYDSPDTFFYLDPPYAIHWPKEDGHLEGKFFDEREMVPALKRIRGKFILSYEMEKARLFKGFKIHRVKTLWTLARHEGTRSKYELLVSNFPLKPVDLYLEKDGRAREKEAGASDLPTEKAVNP
ncbi:MAG: DNA adenine methylase, partial [Elusimicrobia bacterium]|nr:DNA adenine methylase [Elusimicrobiota bacterium]